MSETPERETSSENSDTAGDWRAGIEAPELRRVAEKFASPAEVVKSYAALESRLGRSVVKPGAEASAEEVAAYRRQLGVPENPEGYDLRLPESLPEVLRDDAAGAALRADFLTAMHEAGAGGEVVQRALDWYYATATEGLAREETAAADSRQAQEAELRRDWGGDHERNLALAQRAVSSFGGEDFTAFLEGREVDGVKLGDHPAFVRAFAAIGRSLGEDQPLDGAGGGEAGLWARIDKLHALQQSNPQKYASRSVQSELQGLYAKLYGGQPVVGSEGRRL